MLGRTNGVRTPSVETILLSWCTVLKFALFFIVCRFVRDYMRYKDEIQCHGHTLVQAVRQEALAVAPQFGGEYYALHIRRGDFQFKVRWLSAVVACFLEENFLW